MVTAGDAAVDGASIRGELKIEQDWHRDRMRVIACVQERKSRRILATAAVPLETKNVARRLEPSER
ncbi:MAG TPA: hypothetical protein VKE51_30400 [Vicinamibacterales bacterium]|nr:hypothetical protein [Vicinamibacterales bacterium]